MTLPPNRIGAARGPGGSTLDDIVDALGAVRLAVEGNTTVLEGVATTLGAMAVNLEKLAGPGAVPLDWAGLPAYLTSAIGVPAFAVTPLLNTAATSRDLLSAVSLVLGNTGDPAVVNPATTLYELTDGVLAALSSPAGDNAYNRLGSIRDNSLAILQAIGTLPSTPANETVKTLLQALVDCCGGAAPTPPPLNDPSSSLCSGLFGPFRVQQFVPADTPINLGGTGPSYLLDFGNLSIITDNLIVRDFDTNNTPAVAGPVYFCNSGGVEVCFQWNLTGNPVPAVVSTLTASIVDWYSGERTVVPISPPVTGQGSTTLNLNERVRFSFILDLEESGQLPGLNFWVSFGFAS